MAPLSPGLTWADLGPLVGILTVIFGGLMGAIWAMHQREIATLHDHVQTVKNDLDTFRHTEIKALQEAINKRMDELILAMHALQLAVVQNYMPRAEVEKLIDRRRIE
jgi:hypothetical protein